MTSVNGKFECNSVYTLNLLGKRRDFISKKERL